MVGEASMEQLLEALACSPAWIEFVVGSLFGPMVPWFLSSFSPTKKANTSN